MSDNEIKIEPHNKNWSHQFDNESKRISYALKNNILNIYHIGSTSIPDLAAKPKIDIIAEVKDLIFDHNLLIDLGYKYFFEPNGIKDPYIWTFNHQNHKHFVLYKGIDIIGYAHIQLWLEYRAAIRIIVIDDKYRRNGYGKEFMILIEKYLTLQGYKSIHIESSAEATNFYKSISYIEMPFNDPDNYESSPKDTALGKIL